MVVPVEAANSSDVRESVIVIDGKGLILRFDAGAQHTFGYSADEVIGKNVRVLMPEPYRSAHDKYLADYLRTGEAHIIGIGRKVTATRKDGSNFPAHLSVTEIDFRGAPAFAGILRDITAQETAGAENRQLTLAATSKFMELSSQRTDAEARYRLLADNTVDVVAHLRGNDVVWVSPSVQPAFGWSVEQWIGTDFSPRIHPDDLAIVVTALQEIAEGKSALAQYRIATADGGYHWVDGHGKPYIDAEGNTNGVIVAVRIVDDRVQAEQQFKAQQNRLNAIAGSTPSAISVRDLENRYTLVNDAFCQLFGNSSVEDVIGRTEDEILPPDLLQSSQLAAVRLLAGEHFTEEELIQRGQENISVATQRFPLLDSAGAITELVAIRTDITHRKKIERESAELAMWAKCISAAIVDGRLRVYSQPIVDIATGKTVDEELLIRLRDVDTDVDLPPSEFLPQCEQHGLMPLIDRWMIGRAIDLAATGRHVSVNITGQTLANPATMDSIFEALTGADLDVTDKILFEITETTAIAVPESAKIFSRRVRDLGCRVALDDFGTGYGTFTELRNLTLDELKIDLSFVQNMLTDPGDERAVNTILLVAQIYGLTTVAEGVETEATLEKLAAMGVTRAQGYLFGKPKPIVW